MRVSHICETDTCLWEVELFQDEKACKRQFSLIQFGLLGGGVVRLGGYIWLVCEGHFEFKVSSTSQ